MDTTQKPPSLLSLCTGMRGLERGLEGALRILRRIYCSKGKEGWIDRRADVIRVAAILEIESLAALNLVREMEEGVVAPAPVWTDLKTFPYNLFRDKICIITGGYPCQPFSQAGKQRGVDDPRHLFPFILQGITATRPVLCYFENVANHLNQGYDEVRDSLQKSGYTVKEGIFSASQVGAPHIRKRLFILAVANAYCTEQSKKRGDLAKMLGIQEELVDTESRAISREIRNVRGKDDEFKRSEKSRKARTESFTNAGGTVGDSNGEGKQQPERHLGEIRRWIDDAGEELLDHSACGCHGSEDAVCSRRNGAPCSGQAMDHSIDARLERHHWDGVPKVRWQESVRSIASTSLWPAGQGIDQYEWEEPRLESSVGFTIDGFDFTEDLLRMAGNGVVPPQSTIAFLTLIRHFL